jgi:hypothetical protein
MFRGAHGLIAPGVRHPATPLPVTTAFFIFPSHPVVQYAVTITCDLPSFVYLPAETFYFISSKQYFLPHPIPILHFVLISPTHLCILKISI